MSQLKFLNNKFIVIFVAQMYPYVCLKINLMRSEIKKYPYHILAIVGFVGVADHALSSSKNNSKFHSFTTQNVSAFRVHISNFVSISNELFMYIFIPYIRG